MKKLLTVLLCAAMVVTVLSTAVSAAFIKTETAQIYKIDDLTGDEDPYLTGDEYMDKGMAWATYGYGWMTMLDGYSAYMTSPVGNIFEGVFWEPEFAIPTTHGFLKLRIRSYMDLGQELDVRYWNSGNTQSFGFAFPANGEWQELVIDLNAQENFDWAGYVGITQAHR